MANRYEEPIIISLRRISRAIDRYSRQLAASAGLTGPQLICLRTIGAHGPMAPGVLARRVSLSPATVTGILDRLEERGLVARRRLTSDRRRVEVALSDRGREVTASAPSPLQDRFSQRLDALPEVEQQRINDALHEIVRMMEADLIDASPMLSSGPVLAEPEALVEFLGEPDDVP